MVEILVAAVSAEALIVVALLGVIGRSAIRNGRNNSPFICPNTKQMTDQIILLNKIVNILDERLPRGVAR